ncbi:MAG TPA: TIGR01777 family oxidoreductase [Candidatus Binatia bacterium]|nr:TIGR01777 family oxidoreductase [Candidatus Binatia bacterium]
MKVTILGSSGFIGRHLSAALRERGDEVAGASLRDAVAAAEACEGSDAVVNLAGASLAGKRWTAAYKDEIWNSRVERTHALVERLRSLERRPRVFVGSSAVGYYGGSDDDTFVETSPAGSDFLARLCVAWEAEAMRARELGMRVAVVRTGLVFGNDGGALEKLLPPFRLGMGGIVGSGAQWWSWVHVDDIIGVYRLAIDEVDGAVNATAPNPVRNRDFTHALGRALHRPTPFPVPTFALEMLFGEGALPLTSGQRVLPERAEALGYRFAFPSLEGALAEILC